MASWFPAVGLLLGLPTLAVALGIRLLAEDGLQGTSALVVAALLVAGWAAFTRFLHWDALADVTDALAGGYTQDRRQEILADPHTGALGAAAVALAIALQVAAMAAVLEGPFWVLLALVPVLGRTSATFAALLGTPMRDEGLAASVMGNRSASVFVSAAAVSAVSVAVALASAVPAASLAGAGSASWSPAAAVELSFLAVTTLLVSAGTPHVLAARLGGVNGDVMGAGILVTETYALVAAAMLGVIV